MNLTRGINLRKIAEMMPGASGAEVKVRICVCSQPNKHQTCTQCWVNVEPMSKMVGQH